jgi:hypothetical protein
MPTSSSRDSSASDTKQAPCFSSCQLAIFKIRSGTLTSFHLEAPCTAHGEPGRWEYTLVRLSVVYCKLDSIQVSERMIDNGANLPVELSIDHAAT